VKTSGKLRKRPPFTNFAALGNQGLNQVKAAHVAMHEFDVVEDELLGSVGKARHGSISDLWRQAAWLPRGRSQKVGAFRNATRLGEPMQLDLIGWPNGQSAQDQSVPPSRTAPVFT